MFKKLIDFCTETLWRHTSTGHRWLDLLLRPLRFIILTVRNCIRDGAMLHASALTYITMLAIVPVLALGLTSLKAFGAGDFAEQKLLGSIETIVSAIDADPEPQAPPTEASHPPAQTTDGTDADAEAEPGAAPAGEIPQTKQTVNALHAVCVAIFDRINSINFAQIGAIGAAALIFMVISVLGRIENSFNAIWGIPKPRSIWRKFTDYLSVIVVAPLLLVAATSLPILNSLIDIIPNLFGLRTFLEAIGIFSIVVPLLIGTLLLAFLFSFLPNERIRLTSCLLGGFLTVLALTLFFKVCFALQVGIANYSAIYGSLAALPVLLFWIYSSWLIILIGAEVCYVHQNRFELYRQEAFSHASQHDTLILALALTLEAARATEETAAPLHRRDFAERLSLSKHDIIRVATILERKKILLPATDPAADDAPGYVLARCATTLTVADVLNACLDDAPGEGLILRTETLSPPIHPILRHIDQTLAQALSAHFGDTIATVLKKARQEAEAPTPDK